MGLTTVERCWIAVIVTHVFLHLAYLALCKVANLALVVVAEDVATFHHVVDEETAIHTRTHVALVAAVVVSHYYYLCAGVVVSLVVIIGVCLTECCYCANCHHADEHHCLKSRSLHIVVLLCESCDPV